jgi:hypothetical protein
MMSDALEGNKPLFIKELYSAHKMISTRKTVTDKRTSYISEWLKLLRPTSWKIFHIRNIDQIEWRRIVEEVDKNMVKTDKNEKEFIKIEKIMKDNTKILKQIVSKQGCITISEFGLIASHCAWLIVQHSDHDLDFQKEYLRIMKENRGDVLERDINALEGRVVNINN